MNFETPTDQTVSLPHPDHHTVLLEKPGWAECEQTVKFHVQG